MDGALNPALAQRLVDQVAASVAHNVNLMDDEGVIIASLDRSRVGRTHWAAARAAAERVVVRVHPGDADDEVRAGVNAPLIIDGVVLGVVGVTGEPDEVDEVATLVRLALRLILDAESEQDARTARDAIARDLIAGLVTGSVDAAELSARSAAAGGMLGAPFRVIVAVDPRRLGAGAAGPATPPPSAVRLLRAARAVGPGVSVVDLDALWVLSGDVADERVAGFGQRAREEGASVIDSGVLDSVDALADASRRIRALLAVPAVVPVGGARLAELESEAVVAAMSRSARRGLVERVLGRLSAQERRTLEVVVAHRGSLSRAAVQLSLHRNSVAARLERIEERAGWSLAEPAALTRVALALLAARAEEASVR